MSTLRVGLTGGLAAGKSTVAAWLREAGFEVLDADRIVAELYRSGAEGARAVRRLFGASFLTESGAVDPVRLASHVFERPEARRRLETAIHPLVRRHFENAIRDTQGIAILEATLLVEAGLAAGFDFVVTVEADPETRIRRAAARGLDESAARRRLAAQGDQRLRTSVADRVLWNNGTRAQLRHQVDKLVQELREMTGHGESRPRSRG